jgi:hypothetical protein
MANFVSITKSSPVTVEYIGDAAEDLTAYTFVALDGDGNVITAVDTTTKGVIEKDYLTGDKVYAITEGSAFVMDSAGGLTAGMEITSDASGKAIQNTGANGSGVAFNTGTDADDIINIYVKPIS